MLQQIVQRPPAFADHAPPVHADCRGCPAPIAPKAPKPVSAATCSGVWPPAQETLAEIRADIKAQGPDAKKDVQDHVLIAACIMRGIDAGFAIREVGVELGFNGYHIGKLLSLKPKTRPSPWQKGPDGR